MIWVQLALKDVLENLVQRYNPVHKKRSFLNNPDYYRDTLATVDRQVRQVYQGLKAVRVIKEDQEILAIKAYQDYRD